MLKGETITSMREFLQTDYPITELNRWAFTYYVIEYDGTNERKQDIARFIGGFSYGDLTLCNTALMNQYWPHRYSDASDEKKRSLAECIEYISEGDWVCLTCGKFFLVPRAEIEDSIAAWNLKEVPYDVERFKKYYGHVGDRLYEKPYWKETPWM